MRQVSSGMLGCGCQIPVCIRVGCSFCYFYSYKKIIRSVGVKIELNRLVVPNATMRVNIYRGMVLCVLGHIGGVVVLDFSHVIFAGQN